MKRRALAAACLLAATPAGATAPALFYVGHSLLWRDKATGATGELWLNPDGRYAVFFDTLRPAPVLGIAGPFRWEGRQGAYQATLAAGGVQLCLRPDNDLIPRAGESLFHQAGCVILPVHPVGEVFPLDEGGHRYSVALAQGR